MSKIKKDYKFEDFLDRLEKDLKLLKEEILELFEEEDESIELRLRNENDVVYILKTVKKSDELLTVSVDRVKHISLDVEGIDGEFNFDKNFIKPLKNCDTNNKIKVMDEDYSESGW